MDTRIGYPNEHLAGDTDKTMTSPLYATAVGLVMNAAANQLPPSDEAEEPVGEGETARPLPDKPVKRSSVIDRFTEKLKTFLESAE